MYKSTTSPASFFMAPDYQVRWLEAAEHGEEEGVPVQRPKFDKSGERETGGLGKKVGIIGKSGGIGIQISRHMPLY